MLEHGAKLNHYMRKKIKYDDAPKDINFSDLVEVDEKRFGLPSPEEIASSIKLKPQKVTITLDARSVDFFKKKANQYGVKYQSMIREVLLKYSQQHL